MRFLFDIFLTFVLLIFVKGYNVSDDGPISLPFSSPEFYNCSEYNNIADPLDYNVVSIGFEANDFSQIGNYVLLMDNVSKIIYAFEFVFSIQTYKSENPNYTDPNGFPLPITLNLYLPIVSGINVTLGSLVYSNTTAFLIPWRPEPSVNCTSHRWLDPNANCRTGLSVTIYFEIHSGILVGGSIIYIISYNTKASGLHPYNVSGPYDAFNIGLSNHLPDVGMNGMPGYSFINHSNIFTQDSGLFPYYTLARLINESCYPQPILTTSGAIISQDVPGITPLIILPFVILLVPVLYMIQTLSQTRIKRTKFKKEMRE